MLVVGRQQKNLRCLLDECASGWRTTEKLVIKERCPRYGEDALFLNFIFYGEVMYTKKDAIKIVTSAAKIYHQKLANKNFLIIFKNQQKNTIDCFEILFLPRNFQHLTGLELLDEYGNKISNSVSFYNKCKDNKLKENEIRFRDDGMTPLKLKALPKIINFCTSSKMTTTLDSYHPKLTVDRLVGNISVCLGVIKEKNYYIPNTCLLEDIRSKGNAISQILMIMSKQNKKNTIYSKIEYTAKGINPSQLNFPHKIQNIISLNEQKIEKIDCEILSVN